MGNTRNKINSPTIKNNDEITIINEDVPIQGDAAILEFIPNTALTTPVNTLYTDSSSTIVKQVTSPTTAATTLKNALANGSFTEAADYNLRINYVYVSTTGSDSNIGSKESPFATIGAALIAASSNTVIIITHGTYNENLTITQSRITIAAETGVFNSQNVILNGTIAVNQLSFKMIGISANAITINNGGGNYFTNCTFAPTTNNTPSIIFAAGSSGYNQFDYCSTILGGNQGYIQDLGSSVTAAFNNLDSFFYSSSTTSATSTLFANNLSLSNIINHASGRVAIQNCFNCAISSSTAALADGFLAYKNCSFYDVVTNSYNQLNKTGDSRCLVDSTVILPPVPTSAIGVVYTDGSVGLTAPITLPNGGVYVIGNDTPFHFILINNGAATTNSTIRINDINGLGFYDNTQIIIYTVNAANNVSFTNNIGATFPTGVGLLSVLLNSSSAVIRLRYNKSNNLFTFF